MTYINRGVSLSSMTVNTHDNYIMILTKTGAADVTL